MPEVLIEFGKHSALHTYHKEGLKGYIHISQLDTDHHPIYIIDVEGLTPNKLHGFHIHENGVTQSSDLDKTCDSCGGHFNPYGTQHGSILNSNPNERHAGDLINNLKADSDGKCYIRFIDNLTSLYPEDKGCIIGRSIVIHQDTDDLGREGLPRSIPYLVHQDGYNKVVKQFSNTSFEKYPDPKKRKASRENGNAGRRIACANLNLA